MGEPARRDEARARLALIALTAVWGSTFVVIQSGLDAMSPLMLIALRFAIAGLFLAALRPRAALRLRSVLLPALPLSLSMLAGFELQTVGLLTTTPARSAFLTALSVVMVPAVEFVYTRRVPRRRLIASVVLSAAGVTLLFWPLELEWTRGDTLTLIAAVVFAFYIVELSRLARRVPVSELVLAQCVTIAAMAGIAAAFVERSHLSIGWPLLAGIMYLGIVCTAVTFVLMTWAQARVAATEAAVIYTLEPVVASAFSLALGRDELSLAAVAGSAAIVAATLVASTGASEALPSPIEGID